ncbi:MAG TPA: hydantoinase B/oxoprolinase family protein [Stellaceae bacterium]|nr:hydantoinase B/oxoprolinase family protein [Stellaceae bacterium]
MTAGKGAASPVDPITVEIIRNGVIAVTEEMKTNLMRTAYNLIVYEALDFTVGLYTAEGETISIGMGLPMFIHGMAETVKAKLRKFGREGIEPGDILVTNDGYVTGSHLNHVTFTLPIFDGRELVAFACCMAHWPDIGGTLDGVTTDIYQEGLQLPILKYQKAGVVNQDLVDIILMNVRIPGRAIGDLRAQITALKTGERRFLELIGRYGRDAVLGSIAEIMDESEIVARELTHSIPDGVYVAESFMDDDGLDIGKPTPIRVKVEVKGDKMTIDLTDVSKQVRGFYNSGTTTGIGLAQVAYKCLTSPTDYPINDGAFRALEVILPPGRVVSAVRPAPLRNWMSTPMTVIDTIFRALAPAIPERAIAAHHADLVIGVMHGMKDGVFFMNHFGPLGGGWGAKHNEDGVSATVCINDGDTHNSPSEQLEAKFPILIHHYRLRQDSGGAGRHRGGLGVEMCVEALTAMTINTRIERSQCKPWGLEGGLAGEGNRVTLRVDGAWKEGPNAKLLMGRIRAGDAIMIRSGGGGGFGPPDERPLAAIEDDVKQGYVSLEAAERDYGVVFDRSTMTIDRAATEEKRRKPSEPSG